MTIRMIPVLLFLLISVSPAFAGYDNDSVGSGKTTGLNNATTNKLVRVLERGIRQCRKLDSVYRYDCYRQNYNFAGSQLAGNAAYAVPLSVLRDVEQTLERALARNADPTAATVRRGRSVFRAVKPDSTAVVKETFRRALDEAATTLLRSSERAGTHYVRIAQALNSNKILLRAMLRAIDRKISGYIFG